MTKQEFLAMSLPYGLKFKNSNEICEIYGVIGNYYISIECIDEEEHHIQSHIEDLESLILHPLSDLTKEIEHKGEKFVPYKKLDWELQYNYCGMGEVLDFGDCHSGTVNVLDYIDTLQELIEWHFDIAYLISKGEAIDVNTLEENPYK